MTTPEVATRRRLSHSSFCDVTVHDVSTDDFIGALSQMFPSNRTELLAARMREALSGDHSPRIGQRDLVTFGLSHVAYSSTADARGAARSLSCESDVVTLTVDRTRDGASSLRLRLRKRNPESFALIVSAMQAMGFEGFAYDSELDRDGFGPYTLPNSPRAHAISIENLGGVCGC